MSLSGYLDRCLRWLNLPAWFVNLYLFANIVIFIAWRTQGLVAAGQIDFIEISFVVQNLVLAGVVLFRKAHVAVDRNHGHQLVALIAFFSGIALIGQPASADPALRHVSEIIILAANLLGIATLLTLGRCFGILIACRGVQTHGLYRLVRHPMYVSDILLRVGFVVSHYNWLSVTLALLSCGFYVWRAFLEERFLSARPEYRDYMRQVPYRFLPFVF